MSTEVVTLDICSHPTLNEAFELFPLPGGRVYWCEDCKKKIFISNYTLLEDSQARLAGIIGLAFGEQWAQVARKGQI